MPEKRTHDCATTSVSADESEHIDLVEFVRRGAANDNDILDAIQMHGVRVRERNAEGQLPFHEAVRQMNDALVARLLYHTDADPLDAEADGCTAFHAFCYELHRYPYSSGACHKVFALLKRHVIAKYETGRRTSLSALRVVDDRQRTILDCAVSLPLSHAWVLEELLQCDVLVWMESARLDENRSPKILARSLPDQYRTMIEDAYWRVVTHQNPSNRNTAGALPRATPSRRKPMLTYDVQRRGKRRQSEIIGNVIARTDRALHTSRISRERIKRVRRSRRRAHQRRDTKK